MSRVVIWTPNYAPELIGIAPLATDAANWLVQQGHDVQVVTAVPNYPERRIHDAYRGSRWVKEEIDGVHVHRTWVRVRPDESVRDKVLYELSFALLSSSRALRLSRRSDVLVCVVPSLASAVLAGVAKRTLGMFGSGPSLVLWVQDLVVPLIGAVPGAKHPGVFIRMAASAESSAARAAATVVVCSPGFRDYLVARGVEQSRIHPVLNWVDTAHIAPSEPPQDGVVRFVYAGNIGYTQDFDPLVAAARRLGPRVEIEIVGAGNGAARLRESARHDANITISSPVPDDQFPALLGSAHALLVLRGRIAPDANLPSKIATYLASGRPIVASTRHDSAAAEILSRSGAALLVEPEDSEALADAMERLVSNPAMRAELGRRGRQFAVEALEREQALRQLTEAILPSGS
jgi:colanic acid biosynthesis glycosyl transferase WcaI